MQSKLYVLKSVLIMSLALLMAWPLGVYAQDDLPLYCATLADEDCAILLMARERMQEVRSISGDTTFELIISNIPDAPFNEITLDIEQQSAYNFSDEGMAARAKLSDVELIRELLQEDPVAFLGLYSELIVGSSLESSFRISVSEDTMALIEEAIEEESGDPVPFTLPNEFGVSSRIVDGTMYTNLSEMLDPLPGFKALGDVWFGFEYGPMMDITMAAARDDGDLDPMDEDEAAIASQFTAAVSGANGGPLISTVAGLPFGEDILPSIEIERIEDGAGTVRIRTTIDYATLLSEPAVQELLAELIRDPDFGDTDMSDEEMTEAMAVIQLMGPTVLDSLGLEVIEEIDPETGYLVGSEFHLNWDIEALAPLFSMAGGPDLSELEDVPVFSMNGTSAYSDHNSDLVIETPETALIFSIEEILELIPEEELQMLLSGPQEPEYDFDVTVPDVAALDTENYAEGAALNTDAAAANAVSAAADAVSAIDSSSITEEAKEVAFALLEDARTSVDEGEYEAALQLFEAAIEADPTAVAAYNERGLVYYWQGEYAQAITDFSVAIELDPLNEQALANRGSALVEQGLYEEALIDFDAALVLDPAYSRVYAERADLYYSLDVYDLSLADYALAIEFDPDNPYLYIDRGLVNYSIGEYEDEIADYTSAIRLDPEYSRAYYYRALTYEDLGMMDEALADYSEVVALEPDDSGAYYDRAILHQAVGNNAEAAADFERYLELEPEATNRADVEALISELQ